MATEIALPADVWTKVVDNKSAASFQNVGQWPVEFSFTATDSAPENDSGFIYPTYQGGMKETFTDITYVATPLYLWGKPIGGKTGKVRVEFE